MLEIKTRAEGQTEPLSSVTASHVCQTELQMKCVGDEVQFTILQSFVPESKKSKYFLIARNDSFIASFLPTCSSNRVKRHRRLGGNFILLKASLFNKGLPFRARPSQLGLPSVLKDRL